MVFILSTNRKIKLVCLPYLGLCDKYHKSLNCTCLRRNTFEQNFMNHEVFLDHETAFSLPGFPLALRSFFRRIGPMTESVFHLYEEMSRFLRETQPWLQRDCWSLLSHIKILHCRYTEPRLLKNLKASNWNLPQCPDKGYTLQVSS